MRSWKQIKPLVLLSALLLFCSLAPAQPQHRTFTVPFHTVRGMILLDGTVNGKPASLLLDTGANYTIVSPEAIGLTAVGLQALQATAGGTAAEGEYVKRSVDFGLSEKLWFNRPTLVMNLSETSKRLGTRVDGFVGEDLLREFSAVRIDYQKHVVELELDR